MRRTGCTSRPGKGSHETWYCPCGEHHISLATGHREVSPGLIGKLIKTFTCHLGGCGPLLVQRGELYYFAIAYAVGRSLSFSMNTRPTRSTELFGEAICVAPLSTVPFQSGPLRT